MIDTIKRFACFQKLLLMRSFDFGVLSSNRAAAAKERKAASKSDMPVLLLSILYFGVFDFLDITNYTYLFMFFGFLISCLCIYRDTLLETMPVSKRFVVLSNMLLFLLPAICVVLIIAIIYLVTLTLNAQPADVLRGLVFVLFCMALNLCIYMVVMLINLLSSSKTKLAVALTFFIGTMVPAWYYRVTMPKKSNSLDGLWSMVIDHLGNTGLTVFFIGAAVFSALMFFLCVRLYERRSV